MEPTILTLSSCFLVIILSKNVENGALVVVRWETAQNRFKEPRETTKWLKLTGRFNVHDEEWHVQSPLSCEVLNKTNPLFN